MDAVLAPELHNVRLRPEIEDTRPCTLQVLENSTCGTEGTLLAAVENCATPAGRRLLRQWLVRPLAQVGAIVKRQDAVAALMGPAQEAASRARSQFAGVPPL